MKPLQAITGTSHLCPGSHAFWKAYPAAYSHSAQRRTSDAHAAHDAAMIALLDHDPAIVRAVRSP